MTSPLPRLSRLRPIALLLLLAVAPGCGAHAAVPKTPLSAQGEVHPLGITDKTFGPELLLLLGSSEASPTRQNRLIGVVRYQLGRAAELFDSGHDEAGRGAVEGALYLVRAGEFHPSMLKDRTTPLALGAGVVARQGSDGRALALYSMLDRVLPAGAERSEISGHLSAIRVWQEGTRSRGPLQAASNDSASAIDNALWDPSNVTLRAARAATIEWIDRAIGYGKEQMPPTNELEQNEAIEAYRAIRIGAMELAALYLRNGSAAGALEATETPRVARVVSPHLHDALKRAAEDKDPEAWLELFSTFDRLGSADSDVALDADLAGAAAWGAAVELYRVEPKTMRGTMPLATLLMRRGMGEVGPLLMKPIVESTARVEIDSWTLGYVLETLMGHDAVSDVAAARRTFENATPVFTIVDKQPFAKDVTPSIARVRYAMGALEVRAGDLTRARPLVEAAAKSEPTLPALELLAAIDRQRGAAREAVLSLQAVEKFATEASDPAAVADARLTAFEIYRDEGNAAQAATALEGALRRALDAKKLARTGPEQAAAERVLARVLEQYGNLDGARRATGRAFDASRSDLRQLTATVLDAGRRGLTHSDLRTLRDATRRALEANLASDDLVYVALWLRLLERRLGKPSDGTVEEAFARIDDDDGWPAKLRSWGQGRLTGEQLFSAARGRVEQSEATFYTAMAAFVANDTRAVERIEHFAKSESIELVEVAIARDFAAEKKRLDLKLPKDVDVP
jgi:tetratricopeptide (TPR) repeat protein